MRCSKFLLVIVAVVMGVRFASAADMNHATSGTEVTVSVDSPFSDLPPGGSVPYRATIKNDRNAAGTWRLFFQSTSVFESAGARYFAQDVTVAANSSASFDLLVPLAGGNNRGSGNLAMGVSGPGIDGSDMMKNFFAYVYSNNYGPKSPFTLIGQNVLGAIGLGPLESSYKDHANSFYGSVVDPTNLPSDWRAYSGVAAILLKDTEWLGLSTGQRQAVTDYVVQGGQLTLLTSEDPATRTPELQLPGPESKPGNYGFGAVWLEQVPTFPPDAVTLSNLVEAHHSEMAENVDEKFSTWLLRGLVGTIAISGAFILAFVVVFGALIGPINLFVFARGAKRFRLFWTTPLISILASLALIAGILLVDGLGGTGRQMVVIYSLPQSNREAVIQEQIARTAVLFSSAWHNDQEYLITPLSYPALQSSSGTPGFRSSNPGSMSSSPDVFRQIGDAYSGSWFRSRALSGQYLQAMRPSRSSLTVLNPSALGSGAPPEVLSSYPQKLSRVFLCDSQGRFWTCGSLEPGVRQVCAPSSNDEFNRFWRDATSNAGGKLRPFLEREHGRAGCFFASAPMSSGESLATLGEVRWRVAQGIYLGPWVAAPITGAGP